MECRVVLHPLLQVIRMALHVALHLEAQAWTVVQCSCTGAGGDSGAADWGPEPAGARIATWFWEVIPYG